MPTIVKRAKTDKRYILLGTGFGSFQSKKPNWLLGDLMADTTEGQYTMACISDSTGKLYWVDSTELVVESVDGQPVAELI